MNQQEDAPTAIRRRRRRGLRALPLAAVACMPLALLASGAAAKGHGKSKGPVKGATYTGTTSEMETLSFKVSTSGRDVLSLTTDIGYDGACGQGGGPGFDVDVKSIAIEKGGKFSAKTTGVFPSSTLKVEPMKLKVTGTIDGATASGSVAEVGGKCKAPASGNPYSETFTAKAP
jgi:hypothetical protein